jgi:hypothetical protein
MDAPDLATKLSGLRFLLLLLIFFGVVYAHPVFQPVSVLPPNSTGEVQLRRSEHRLVSTARTGERTKHQAGPSNGKLGK